MDDVDVGSLFEALRLCWWEFSFPRARGLERRELILWACPKHQMSDN